MDLITIDLCLPQLFGIFELPLGNNAVASFHPYRKLGHDDFVPNAEFSKDVVDAG